jgi:hypothetical protein
MPDIVGRRGPADQMRRRMSAIHPCMEPASRPAIPLACERAKSDPAARLATGRVALRR